MRAERVFFSGFLPAESLLFEGLCCELILYQLKHFLTPMH